jgi:hypothetical protein
LKATDSIHGKPQKTKVELFRQIEKVEGEGYKFLAENFQKVNEGEVYAEKSRNKKKAEESFYPILMSTEGYDDLIGHKAKKISGREIETN